MDTLLYLTQREADLYTSVDSGLRSGWSVINEEYTCYESPRQLQMRLHLADFTAYPDLVEVVNRIKDSGGDITPQDIDGLDPHVLKELLFVMGAAGVEKLIAILLQEISTDEDVQLLSMLSHIRHHLLEINSKATHV